MDKSRRPETPQAVYPDGEWRLLDDLVPTFGVCVRTLRRWCDDGTFDAFGYRVYRHRRAWWVDVSKNATNSTIT